MRRETHEFLDMFSTFNNNDERVIFGDCFSEFIECLNNCDLSNDTLVQLNGIFIKDMKRYFELKKKSE